MPELLALLSDDDFAGALHNGVSNNHLAHAVQNDLAGAGILYRLHMTVDGGVDIGIFKSQVGILHAAVDELQILAVAQRLGADDFATHQGQVFREPAQVFSANDAVYYGHIFAVPESVLGVQETVADFQVFHVLKGILALDLHMVQGYIAAVEEEVLRTHLAVHNVDSIAFPAKLGRVNGTAVDGDVLAASECFDAAQVGIGDFAIFGIPDCCTASVIHPGIVKLEFLYMPQRISQREAAIVQCDVPGFLQCGFAICRACKYTVYNFTVGQMVKGPLLIVAHSFYSIFHNVYIQSPVM